MIMNDKRGRKYELTLVVLFLSTFLLLLKGFGMEILSEKGWVDINSIAVGAYLGANVLTKGINAYTANRGRSYEYDGQQEP